MTDHNAALHAQRFDAIEQKLDRECAYFAGLVEMDIDGLLMPVCNLERCIERLDRVLVDQRGVQRAEYIGA